MVKNLSCPLCWLIVIENLFFKLVIIGRVKEKTDPFNFS